MSERRACGLVGMQRSTLRYESRRSDDSELRERLRELATERVRFGYRRLCVLLRREGMKVNHKRVYRIYREEQLAVRKRSSKRARTRPRQPLTVCDRPAQRWSMDFMSDATSDGRVLRILNIVDDFTRECLAICVDSSIPGARVVRTLERLAGARGLPEIIVTDNGPEFRGKALSQWAYENGVKLHFIEPAKPAQNAFVESFNGKFRDECLNQHWFKDIEDARRKIETWRLDYNRFRPHSALGYQTPAEFAKFAAALGQQGIDPLTKTVGLT